MTFLDGSFVGGGGAGGGGSSLPVVDTTEIVKNVGDETKRVILSADNVPTGTVSVVGIYTSVNLSTVGGTFQLRDDILDQIAALNPLDDRFIYFAQDGDTAVATLGTITAAARTLIAASTQAAQKAALGIPLDKTDGTTAPGVTDDSADGFSVNSRWIDTVAGKSYVCTDASLGAALWRLDSVILGTDTQPFNANLAELAALVDADGFLKNTSGTLTWTAVSSGPASTVGTGGDFADIQAGNAKTVLDLKSDVPEDSPLSGLQSVLVVRLNGFKWSAGANSSTLTTHLHFVGPGTVAASTLNQYTFYSDAGSLNLHNVTWDGTTGGGTNSSVVAGNAAVNMSGTVKFLAKNQAYNTALLPSILTITASGVVEMVGGGTACENVINCSTFTAPGVTLSGQFSTGTAATFTTTTIGLLWLYTSSACGITLSSGTNVRSHRVFSAGANVFTIAGFAQLGGGDYSATLGGLVIATNSSVRLDGVYTAGLTFSSAPANFKMQNCFVTGATTINATTANVSANHFSNTVALNPSFTGCFQGNSCAQTFDSGACSAAIDDNLFTGAVTITSGFTGSYGPGNTELSTFTNNSTNRAIIRKQSTDRSLQTIGGDFTADLTVANGIAYFTVPPEFDGFSIVGCHIRNITAGAGGVGTYQFEKGGNNIFSTAPTIDDGETGTNTAATPPVVNATYKVVAAYDLISFNCTGVQTTTPAKGAIPVLFLRKE